jgi:multidrug resistance efflux pump
MNAPRLPAFRSTFLRIPVVAWVGIGLLTASLAGVAWGLHTPSGNSTAAPGGTASRAAPQSDTSRAVCFGFVDVRDGVIPVVPLLPGQVVKIEDVARDGTKELEAGTPLFHMDATVARAQLEEAQAGVADAEAQLKNARTLPAQHQQQVKGQQAALKAKQHELEVARLRLTDARRLAQSDLTRPDTVRMAEEAVKALENAVEGEEAKLKALELLDPTVAVTRAEQELARRKAEETKARFALQKCTITAPCKGTVLRLLVAPGETLGSNPRQPALWFCPSGKRIIRAEVYQEFANRVALNQPARIEDDTRAGPTWKGKVVHVGDWFTQRRSILLEPLQLNDVRTLECIIEVDDQTPPLRIGQRVRVILDGP